MKIGWQISEKLDFSTDLFILSTPIQNSLMQFILLNNPFTTGEYFKIASLVVPLVHSLLHPTTTSVSHSCWYYQVYGSKYNYLAIVISFQVEQPMLHVYLRHVYSKYRLISLKCSSMSYILFIVFPQELSRGVLFLSLILHLVLSQRNVEEERTDYPEYRKFVDFE